MELAWCATLNKTSVYLCKANGAANGTGGAARGVQMPLVLAKVQRLVIATRTLEKAEEMLMYGHQHYGKLFGIEIVAKTTLT